MLHLPKPNNQITAEIKGSDPEILIPGIINRVLPSVLPSSVTDGSFSAYVKLAERFRGTCKSQSQTHPVYPVGPVIDLKGGQADDPSNLDKDQHDKIIKWLDEQPQSSIVFLCFGSMGSFGATQSLRLPPVTQGKTTRASKSSNSEDILPDGFLGRVLAHKATGGFVSHCGWNSILESLWYGVPVVTWPISAEQQLNAFRMVRELGLAEELRLDYRKGSGELVVADEIENGVTKVMDRNSEVRKKVKDMAEKVRRAAMDGGSSFISIGKLIDDMMGFGQIWKG
ncbi:UDP-glycosyltransferase 71K1-like [Prunus yedoensis var. nudiflora]|uniref:UDP-glycosyltransferase 71K1-like n=1 Tax=Prunus yedoensis var. nudiflora TaxID=2094558 RepID=A0A314UC83_PRUYE|nr:UDP-glycosyltransferase 71K1-like [Prunus yedoensis var. nudiflora]